MLNTLCVVGPGVKTCLVVFLIVAFWCPNTSRCVLEEIGQKWSWSSRNPCKAMHSLSLLYLHNNLVRLKVTDPR